MTTCPTATNKQIISVTWITNQDIGDKGKWFCKVNYKTGHCWYRWKLIILFKAAVKSLQPKGSLSSTLMKGRLFELNAYIVSDQNSLIILWGLPTEFQFCTTTQLKKEEQWEDGGQKTLQSRCWHLDTFAKMGDGQTWTCMKTDVHMFIASVLISFVACQPPPYVNGHNLFFKTPNCFIITNCSIWQHAQPPPTNKSYL